MAMFTIDDEIGIERKATNGLYQQWRDALRPKGRQVGEARIYGSACAFYQFRKTMVGRFAPSFGGQVANLP
jgi:hypothetical protein